MMECLRLLAGFTSFISKQAFTHASSIGPDGILASSFILFYEPQQYADWDGDVSKNDENGDSAGGASEIGREFWMREADRLEHAPEAVAKMKAEQANGDDVPGRNPPDLKYRDDVVIDVACDELRLGMYVAGGELEQMEHDEDQDNRPAPVHGARGVGRVDRLFARVANRPRCLTAERKLYRCGNVQRDGQQQDAALNPEQLAKIMQEVAVGVDVLGGLEHLEVAEHVADNEGEHHGAGHGHDYFFAVRGLPKSYRMRLMRDKFCCTHSFPSAFVRRVISMELWARFSMLRLSTRALDYCYLKIMESRE